MRCWRTFRSQIIYNRFFIFVKAMVKLEGAPYILVVNVNVNDDGLNVNVNRLENANVWDGTYRHRVVSRNFLVSPSFLRGSFLIYAFLPATKHAANFIQLFGQSSIFKIRKTFIFPSQLQEEFEAIKF